MSTSTETGAVAKMLRLDEEMRIKREGRKLYNLYMDGNLNIATLTATDYAMLKTYMAYKERQEMSMDERINFIGSVMQAVVDGYFPASVLESLDL